MTYVRESLTGTSPQDIMKLNNNFEQLWGKVFGDINFSDGNTDLKNRISTQWLPAQGEGNLSTGFPLYVRFYIPPDVKTIKSTSFNIMLSRYRMDSGISENNETQAFGGGTTSTSDTTAVVGVNSGGYTNNTYPVETWNGRSGSPSNFSSPLMFFDVAYGDVTIYDDFITKSSGGMLLRNDSYNDNGNVLWGIDMKYLQHTHRVEIPSHGHSVALSPHNHSFGLSLTLPAHTHNLAEGIKVSSNAPATVTIKLNGTSIGTIAGDNTSQNNIDVKDNVNIGQWNTFEFSCTGVARITVYGIIEMILKYFD